MRLRTGLLGSTAIVGATMLLVSGATAAAEVKPGGALDLTITGFARFEAGGGEQDDLNLDSSFARGLDFINDTEVHILARGRSEQTGIEYGATVEFLADTNETENTDETWIFLRGGWGGELRLGDEDGVVDNSIIGGQTIAAGTGGIDGSDLVILPAPARRCSRRGPTTPPRSATTRRASVASASASATPRRCPTSTAAPTTASSSPARAAPTPCRPRTSSKAA
jgi:Gram-negative porin